MGSLEIRPVHSTGDLRRFIRLPFRLYRDEPNWVAPLIFERKQFLDRRKNPFFEHGRAEYFLALRDGRPVGRITAQVDDNFQRFQENRWGWFGFFECEEDPEAARRCSTAPSSGCAGRAATAWSGRPTSRPTTSAACCSRATSARR